MGNDNVVHTSGEEPEVSVAAEAVMKALGKRGNQREESHPREGPASTTIPDLRDKVRQLQREIIQRAVTPRTPEEVLAYDQGLQGLGVQLLPEVVKVEAFIALVEERGLEEEPAIAEQLTSARVYLKRIEEDRVLTRYVGQAKKFRGLLQVNTWTGLTAVLEQLLAEKALYKGRRDPRWDLPKVQGFLREMEAIPSRENGVEFFYAPNHSSILAQFCWGVVDTTYHQIRKAWAERRETIEADLEPFKAKATSGLSVYKAVHKEEEGLLYLSPLYPEKRRTTNETGKVTYEETGRRRLARMLIRVARGNFTVEEVFGPDRIEFILNQSRYLDGKPRWFPLYPERFDQSVAPPAISQIVWPVLREWYDNEAEQRQAVDRSREIQAKSTITPVELVTNVPGFCGTFVRGVRTRRGDEDDLTLGIQGTGQETFILEEYISRYGVFDFEASVGQESPLQEEELEPYQKLGAEEALRFNQARTIRDLLQLAANCQRSAEIQAKRKTLSPIITVTEGQDGKTGHSIFHIRKAMTNTWGPVHVTCYIEWQEEGFTPQEYVSWAEPGAKSRGPLELDEAIGVLIPRQPAKDEEPVIQALRHLLEQRRNSEAWYASQGKPPEEEPEGENGPPSNNN